MVASRAESQHAAHTGRRRSNTAQSLMRPGGGTSIPPLPPPTPLRYGDSKVLNLWVHDNRESSSVLFNQSWWTGVAEGDVLRLTALGSDDALAEQSFLFIVPKDEGCSKPQLQISIPRSVAEACGLRNNSEVIVRKVDKSTCAAHYVEVIFQDQYLGRNDMWRLGQNLVDQCLHVNQEITFLGGTVGRVQNIYIDGQKTSAAHVKASTRMIYRSLSAKVTIFIQVCQELWEFAPDGERYNEKIVHSFLPALFEQWKEAGTNHTVTIVLISRVYYEQSETGYAAGPLQQDENGSWYKDFFKVITDLEIIDDWKPTLVSLKNSFVDFQRDILLTHHYHRGFVDPSNGSTEARLVGRISFAHDGPILEAINLALNPTESHYIDRSLTLTGTLTILITPGTGHFRVSKRLLRLTTTRLLDQGFGVNLICLAKPPLHQSPIFSFQGFEPESKTDRYSKFGSRTTDPLWGGDYETSDPISREKVTFWWEPFWMSVSFWDLQMDLPFRQDRFIARAKMHEIQMLGLLEHDVLANIEVPFLPDHHYSLTANNGNGQDDGPSFLPKSEADAFDMAIFTVKPETKPPSQVDRTSFLSSSSSTIVPSSYRSERRSLISHRASVVSNQIPPIQESPRHIIMELPPESDSDRISSSYGLSASPSQSSVMSSRSQQSMHTTVSSLLTKVSRDDSSSRRSSLSLRLAPTWLFSAFKSAATEPKTTPISASATASPSPIKTPSSAAPTSGLSRFSSASKADLTPQGIHSRSPKAIAIKNVPSSRSALNRAFDDDTPTTGRLHRPSPTNTLREDSTLPKRRGTVTSISSPHHMSPSFKPNPLRPRPHLTHSQLHLARRWQHLTPCPSYKHDIKWKALVTPACLPLTVESFPTASELESSYDMFQYDFVVDPQEMRSFLVKPPAQKGSPDEIRRAWALVVMRGMVAVRLAQGFQFVLRPTCEDEVDIKLPSSFRRTAMLEEELTPRPSGAAEVLRSTDDPVYLSMSNEIHRLAYTGDSIQVRRYVRRMPPMPPWQYQCLIWPKLGVGYTEHKTSFTSYGLENYGWNRLDMLVAGYEHEFSDSLRYWRTRFLVIPTAEPPAIESGPSGEALNDEEIRLVGVEKLADQFSRIRWPPVEERTSFVRFLPTTLGPAACVMDDTLIAQLDEIHTSGPLKKKMKSEREISNMAPSLLAKAMREEEGLIKQYQWHKSHYPNSFTGFDFVSWLVREFRDVSSRAQAAEIGVKLLEQGLIEHCKGSHGFLDGHYFYRLKGEYSVQMTPRGWFRSTRNVTTDETAKSGLSLSNKLSSPRRNKKRLILSQSTVIDIDPHKKSDQAESVILHHDIIHNPATALHFELQWIGTTARCIEDMLRQFNRSIERYGLLLVEGYVTQISDIRERNPFQSCFPVRLALPPPNIPNIEKRVPEGVQASRYFEYMLLKKFDFILDMEAADMYPEKVDVIYSYRRSAFKYSQFVHRSGVAFVQVLGGEQGFLFLTNRLMGPGRLGTAKSKDKKLATRADDVRVALHAFCSDETALRRFYEEEEESLRVLPEEPPPLSI